MPNEQIDNIAAQGQAVPDQAMGGQEASPAAPADLAEAFAQVRKANAEAAEGSMAAGGDADEPRGKHAKQQESDEPEGQEDAGEPAQPATADEDESQADGDMGGHAAVGEPVNYDPARQQIYQQVNQQATRNVVERFQQNNIRMWEIADLYEKDEQTGRVTFRNPDDENRPFQSRKEAQDFVDAMNKQITNKFRSEVMAEQQKMLEAAQPSLNVLNFVPIYQSMSDIERGVFDDLITPYAIRDAQGNIQGFNVDLGAAAKQAKTIAARFAQQPGKQQEAKKQEGGKNESTSAPAMDMTTGTGDVADDEPKDLAEAFMKLNEQKKKEKKNG